MPDISPQKNRVRWLAFSVLLIGQLMILLDVSVVNIALPTIEHELQFSAAALSWVVNAYLITFGGFLLLSGKLADLFGHKKVFMWGMAIFTIASFFCGFAASSTLLIVSRFVQGFGAALVSSVVLGILYKLFTDKNEQIKSLGYYGLIGAAGASIGLVLGGILTELVSWHWIFYINVPFGIIAIIAGIFLIPSDEGSGIGKGVDVAGALIVIVALVLLNYAIIKVSTAGFLALQTLGCFIGSIIAFGIFALVENRLNNPLISFKIFKVKNIVAANVTQFFVTWTVFGVYFLTALYLQNIYHLTPIWAGFAFVPQTGVYGLVGIFFAPWIMKKIGARKTVLYGAPIAAFSFVLFGLMPLHPNYWLNVLPPMLIFALGGTMASIPLSHLAMSEVKKEDAGLASGLINTSRQVGGDIGIAIGGSIAAAYTVRMLSSALPQTTSLLKGYQLSFMIYALTMLIPFFIALRFKSSANNSASEEEQEDRVMEVGEI